MVRLEIIPAVIFLYNIIDLANHHGLYHPPITLTPLMNRPDTHVIGYML